MANQLKTNRKSKHGSPRAKMRSIVGSKMSARKNGRSGKRGPHKNNRAAVPQKVLLHTARTVPTPEIFNDVPEKMPFSTDNG